MPSSRQSIYEVYEHQKAGLLVHLFEHLEGFDKVVVFVQTRAGVHTLTSALSHAGLRVESIHGNKKAELRDRALKDFTVGRVRALVTTGAVVRNTGITGVENVVNYEVPERASDYLYHAGGARQASDQDDPASPLTGQVITLMDPGEISSLLKLESAIGKELPRKTSPGFNYASQPVYAKPQRKKGGKSKGLKSKPLQNKKPKFKNKRGRK